MVSDPRGGRPWPARKGQLPASAAACGQGCRQAWLPTGMVGAYKSGAYGRRQHQQGQSPRRHPLQGRCHPVREATMGIEPTGAAAQGAVVPVCPQGQRCPSAHRGNGACPPTGGATLAAKGSANDTQHPYLHGGSDGGGGRWMRAEREG
ncbi:hypothetical protein GW17_00002335 [Ensete ventricosum]|nr:hypothetical protein GW17_00002335 [Ensete ventricosum]